MLQSRKLKIVFVCLIIAIAIRISEQRHQQQQQQQQHYNQGQTQGRRNIQHQHQPQTRQLEQRITQERQSRSREILKYMNPEADVCKDFYNFACGNWLQQQQNATAANEGELISVQSVMEQLVNKQLQVSLTSPITSLDSMEVKAAKDFYRTCLRVPASSPAQRQFMQAFVVRHGGLPDIRGTHWQTNYNWVYVIADLRHNYGLDILIGLTIDKTNPNHRTIFIEEPQTTMLPVELCSSLATRQIDEKDQAFEKIQEEIKENLKSWLEMSESNALRIAGAIIRFEFDLCKYMRLDQTSTTPLDRGYDEQQPFNTNRRGSPERLVENKMHGIRQNMALQNLRSLSENYHINFKDFVDHSLNTATVSQVYFRNEEYFQQLSIIAQKGLQASFANYIMYRALSEINFPLNERQDQRPFYCTNRLLRYLPQALGQLYNEKFHHMEAKQDVQEMFAIIKQAFAKYLQTDVNWMSDNTKRAVKQKLNTLKITYPSYPQNGDDVRGLLYHDNNNDYWRKLQNIMIYNANQTIFQARFTNDHFNTIEASSVSIQQKPMNYELTVGFGLLQKPFYSQFHANSLKYSSIGVALAREIIKLFDLQDLQQNHMATFPWDPSTMDNFFNISECFRAQISNHFHNHPYIFRNATKLRDIAIETSAVNIAFKAYLHWLEQPERQRSELQWETLPDINFTNTQLFFINFAQTRCAARNKIELPPDFLPLYRRTWEQYDINGPLMNNVEFGREFSCELGTDMNLDDKCLLY